MRFQADPKRDRVLEKARDAKVAARKSERLAELERVLEAEARRLRGEVEK